MPRRMCVNSSSPGGKPWAVFYLLYGRLSAMWSAVRVCRHGWFDSKGGFLYSGSSSGRAAVSKTAGCRFEPCLECQTLHDRGTACRE